MVCSVEDCENNFMIHFYLEQYYDVTKQRFVIFTFETGVYALRLHHAPSEFSHSSTTQNRDEILAAVGID